MKNKSNDYVIRILDSPLAVNAGDWNALLAAQSPAGILNPFMRHEYLAALHASGSATPKTGWTPRFVTLWLGDTLAGACALYLKAHSYGEYVFDWAWANAYAQNGLDYYPKALVAVPFTPVPGARLLARNADERALLVKALVAWCDEEKLSSLHLLFASDDDVAACQEAGLMLRHTVQFHWTNSAPTLVASRTALPRGGAAAPVARQSRFHGPGLQGVAASTLVATHSALSPEPDLLLPSLGEVRDGDIFEPEPGFSGRPFASFDDFLMTLSQEKRKKIRQERRKVRDAGITFRWSLGQDISSADWDFFYRCYERTYLEHGNAPYLSRDFFHRMESSMPENWLLFIAEHEGKPIASSLIAVSARPDCGNGIFHDENTPETPENAGNPPFQGLTAYGRYWGALARVDCLHFEACYYQPIEWCIAHGFQSFEGGAQGEHKMARALLPVKTTSAHWLAHPSFADAVERFLEREGAGIDQYMEDLERRSPFKAPALPNPTDLTIPS
ncbi:GNAT family N-acetyltransferase [Polaromonas sp.]|uniref:GNAT family N-acetyltransferase n=1 Tax=Polaromonas sp. TaxID=1869339 RepID=UPI0013BD8128|nr:GNAT family N-acetyltransferase [Polaromonas sp.]NDP63703.1 N-acetyltransferase [Polaromonas sp.]